MEPMEENVWTSNIYVLYCPVMLNVLQVFTGRGEFDQMKLMTTQTDTTSKSLWSAPREQDVVYWWDEWFELEDETRVSVF